MLVFIRSIDCQSPLNVRLAHTHAYPKGCEMNFALIIFDKRKVFAAPNQSLISSWTLIIWSPCLSSAAELDNLTVPLFFFYLRNC